MKNYFKNFAALVLSVLLVAGITACNNEFESGNINEAPKGQIILDNDFVTIRMVNNEARAITEQVPYTKEDWAYSTTTVTYGGVSDTTEFYSKNSSINVECKKEGQYTFKSTAYKADQKTIIATSDPVIKNVTFNNGDFDLTITYTNIENYEATTGVIGAIKNQWEEEKTAILTKDWFNNENAPSKWSVKSISFIKKNYTGPFTKTWSGGENITVYYNSNDGSIVVSAAGRKIFAPKYCSRLFSDFKNVISIDLNNFDTSNVTDMSEMFGSYDYDESCSNLTTLDVSNFNTSNVTGMSGMFYNCEKLTSLDVSNFDTSNVTNMSRMFYGCEKLTSLDVSNFNTSKVINMSYMFCYCINLTTLDVSNFDTSKVTNMGDMFHSLNLTTLDVSNFDTSKVTDMSLMFFGCDELTTLDVSNFDTSNVTNMDNMFLGCEKLTTLDVSNFDTSKVTIMGSMFYNCEKLTSLDVSNFDTSKVINMSYMFYHIESITTLDLRNFDTSNVTNKELMFSNYAPLEVIYTPTTWTLGTDWYHVTFVAK